MIQYSDEWWIARYKKVTASNVLSICKGARGKYLEGRKRYMAEKLVETLTEIKLDNYRSKPMEDGYENEPLARAAYEAESGNLVTEVGFIDHPIIDRFGASPDGVIETGNINLEIKCPTPRVHMEFLLDPVIKKVYLYQMNCQMMCIETQLTHFVSYNPEFADNLSYKMIVVNRDPVICAEIEAETKLFLMELDATIKSLKEL